MTKGPIIEYKIDTKKRVLKQRKRAPENQGDTKVHFYSQNLDFYLSLMPQRKKLL